MTTEHRAYALKYYLESSSSGETGSVNPSIQMLESRGFACFSISPTHPSQATRGVQLTAQDMAILLTGNEGKIPADSGESSKLASPADSEASLIADLPSEWAHLITRVVHRARHRPGGE